MKILSNRSYRPLPPLPLVVSVSSVGVKGGGASGILGCGVIIPSLSLSLSFSKADAARACGVTSSLELSFVVTTEEVDEGRAVEEEGVSACENDEKADGIDPAEGGAEGEEAIDKEEENDDIAAERVDRLDSDVAEGEDPARIEGVAAFSREEEEEDGEGGGREGEGVEKNED
jgi:hypothetical protein